MGVLSGPSPAAEIRDFDIPAGPAENAVRQFGEQAHMSVLYEPRSLDHFKTRAIKGKYEPAEALRKLLDDSGLDFSRTSKHLVDVRPGLTPGRSGAEGPDLPTVEIAARGSSSLLDLPAGVVIRTINSEELSRQGFTTVPDWVRSLTQNQGIGANEATGYYGVALSNVAYGSGLNLYGIGQRATLILLNGQRLAPSGSEGSFTDISNIPLSAIERIELISDGASTIYGADAVGGIVNFVLRGGYSRPMTTLSLGPPGSLSEHEFGHSFSKAGDHWRVLAGLELYSRNALPASERSQATNDLTPWGGNNFDTPYGNPGTILDSNRQLWGIPSGQNGAHLAPGDLLAVPNEYDNYAGTWMLPQQRRVNGLVNGSFDIADDTEITFNSLFNMRWIKSHVAPLSTALLVPNTNPFYVNPVPGDTSPVQVLYGFGDDFGPIVERGTVRSGQTTLGVRRQLSGDWSLEATAGYTYENQLETQSNLVNYDTLSDYLALGDPASAFNPFGAGSNTSPQTLAAIRTHGANEVKSAFRIANLKAVGSMPLLPAGPVTITAGYDFRLQTFLSTVSPVFNSVGQVFDTDRHRTLHALYLQSSVPVLAGNLSPDTSYELKLAAGVRYEHFSDVGAASLPTLGLSFDTGAGLSLFGTWARMFRPPNMPDLNESINYAAVFPLADPKSPTGYTNSLIWGGNNADLRPETAHSWMAGIKFSPQSDPRVSIDAQYFNIVSFNQILPTQLLPLTLFSDPQYSYLYTRNVLPAAVTNICSHALFMGAAGECQNSDIGAIVDLRLRSAETVKTDGVDFKILQRWDTSAGELSANLQATYVLHFKQTQAPGDDFISYRNTPHYPTALRLRSVFRWENQWLSVSPALNLQSSYTDTTSIPNRPVGAWTTWDLVVAYKASQLDDLIGGNTTVSLRGLNVFNKQPPFLNNNVSFVGFDPENADLLGRRVSLRLEHEW
jgi:iron complex outermembrane recepter protein